MTELLNTTVLSLTSLTRPSSATSTVCCSFGVLTLILIILFSPLPLWFPSSAISNSDWKIENRDAVSSTHAHESNSQHNSYICRCKMRTAESSHATFIINSKSNDMPPNQDHQAQFSALPFLPFPSYYLLPHTERRRWRSTGRWNLELDLLQAEERLSNLVDLLPFCLVLSPLLLPPRSPRRTETEWMIQGWMWDVCEVWVCNSQSALLLLPLCIMYVCTRYICSRAFSHSTTYHIHKVSIIHSIFIRSRQFPLRLSLSAGRPILDVCLFLTDYYYVLLITSRRFIDTSPLCNK